jgi:ABC-type antimicrobial peptide transport system permease subunit
MLAIRSGQKGSLLSQVFQLLFFRSALWMAVFFLHIHSVWSITSSAIGRYTDFLRFNGITGLPVVCMPVSSWMSFWNKCPYHRKCNPEGRQEPFNGGVSCPGPKLIQNIQY